jgi:HAD superfamily hydrolase (TIGR01509 family)
MKISAVIFDMDGLMFDTERISQRTWVRAAADYGYTYPEYVYQSVIGRARPDVERITMQAFGEDFPFEAVYTTKQRYMQETLERDGIPLKPGLITLLDWLNDHLIAMAVASSSPRAVVLRNLRIAGLELERFATIVGGDEVLHGKPAPDIFLEVAYHLNMIPQDCLVLEDSNAGIKAAHAAGMQAVMIPDLRPATVETCTLAYRVVDSLTQVQFLLDEHE